MVLYGIARSIQYSPTLAIPLMGAIYRIFTIWNQSNLLFDKLVPASTQMGTISCNIIVIHIVNISTSLNPTKGNMKREISKGLPQYYTYYRTVSILSESNRFILILKLAIFSNYNCSYCLFFDHKFFKQNFF
jgi:hypothetical protein